MGLAEGGITYRTYWVDGELPSDHRHAYMEQIRHFRFEPLTVESEEDVQIGWVPLQDLLGREFQTHEVFQEPYLVLALRMDRWALPQALLKARFHKAEQAKLIELKRDHLSRLERGDLLEQERNALKRQTLPQARLFDLCWHLERKLLRFSSLSRTVNELFVDLFEQTFSMRLVPDSPYISALNCQLDDALTGRLADVEPSQYPRT